MPVWDPVHDTATTQIRVFLLLNLGVVFDFFLLFNEKSSNSY
jgi:hypothetical protein